MRKYKNLTYPRTRYQINKHINKIHKHCTYIKIFCVNLHTPLVLLSTSYITHYIQYVQRENKNNLYLKSWNWTNRRRKTENIQRLTRLVKNLYYKRLVRFTKIYYLVRARRLYLSQRFETSTTSGKSKH